METGVALRLAHQPRKKEGSSEARLKGLQVPSLVSLAKSVCPPELRGEYNGRCRDVPTAPGAFTTASTRTPRGQRCSVRQRQNT